MISASEITVRVLYSIPFHFLNNMEAADDVKLFVLRQTTSSSIVRRVLQHRPLIIPRFDFAFPHYFFLDARIFYLTY